MHYLAFFFIVLVFMPKQTKRKIDPETAELLRKAKEKLVATREVVNKNGKN